MPWSTLFCFLFVCFCCFVFLKCFLSLLLFLHRAQGSVFCQYCNQQSILYTYLVAVICDRDGSGPGSSCYRYLTFGRVDG